MKKIILLIFLISSLNCALIPESKQEALINAIKANNIELVEELCLQGAICLNAKELTTNPVILNIITNTGADQCENYAYDKFGASVLGSLPESDPTVLKKIAIALSSADYKKRLFQISSFIKSTGIFTLDEWEILLSFGLNINKQDKHEKTALIYLSETDNNEDLISRLINLEAKLHFYTLKSTILSIKCAYRIMNMAKIDKKLKVILSLELVNNSEAINKFAEKAPIATNIMLHQIIEYTKQQQFSDSLLNMLKNLSVQTESILK